MRAGFAAILLAAVPAAVQAQADPLATGRELRLAGRPAEAIAPLEAASRTAPADADVWLNLGLAYAGAHRLADADRALAEAQRLAPTYADVQVARARVAYFRGDFAEARARLAPTLAAAPSDEARALAAQIAAATKAEPPGWRLDATAARSDLSGRLRGWSRQQLALGRRVAADLTLSGSLEHARQFGLDDTYLEAQVVRRRGYLAFGATPSADFRPKWQVRGGLYADPLSVGAGWTAQISVDAAFARYVSGEVRSVQPAATLAKGDSYLVARWINTLDERHDYRSGYAVRGVWRAAPRLGLSAGWADAPESSDGATVNVRAASLGVALDVDEATTLRLDGTREMRDAYDRTEMAVGVTRRF